MRFLLVLLVDLSLLAAACALAWAGYQAWVSRRQARLCASCTDLDLLKAHDNVCPGCGQLRRSP